MLRLLRQYYPIRNIFFIIGEALLILISIYAASHIILHDNQALSQLDFLLKMVLIGFVCQTCLYYNDLYDFTIISSYSELTIRLFQALGVSAILLAIVYTAFPGTIIGEGIFALSTAFIILFIIIWRYGYKLVLDKGVFNQKIVLVGSGELALNISQEIQNKPDCGYTLGVVVRESGQESITPGQLPCVERSIQKNNYEGLCDIAKELGIEKIVVALREKRGNFPIKELLKCRVDGIDIIHGNTFYEMLTGKLIVEHLNPSWLIFENGFKKSWAKRVVKRITDIFFSVLLLILTSPIIILISIIIKLDSKGPVIFSQERVGQGRRPYMIHKFRSMVADAETKSGPVWAQAEDKRITRIGNFIRKWRIDEIPQLWNVLRGDMSFVGPRPEREFFIKQLEKIIPYYGERMSVKPGVTGWAQVSYGYGASVEDAVEKLNYDLFYIKNMSILMDILVVLRTIKTVLFGKGR
jgi:sugar transferase (PEP-CTERM system associated)